MEITGLILAGGAGRRMGGADKGLQPWRGAPLVSHVASALRPQVSQLLISCNRNRDHYAHHGELAPVDLRPDYQGPLAGLEAATPKIATPFLLVVPCDSPALPTDLAEQLLRALLADPALDLVYARCPQGEHYLHALLRTDCLETLPAFLDGGGRAVRRWYAELATGVVGFADSEGFHNVNELDS